MIRAPLSIPDGRENRWKQRWSNVRCLGLTMALRVLLLVSLLFPACAFAGDEDVATGSFFLPTPDGWRTETIAFPLGFAPELEYEGVEELRFAPGMFNADSEDFWTYAFVWWISDRSSLEPAGLAKDLEFYFAGLTRAVAPERGFDASAATHDVQLAMFENGGDDSEIDFKGGATVFDPFATGESISLNIRVKQTSCLEEGRLAVVFELSPQPLIHQVWSSLAGIRDGFRCSK